MATVFIKKEMNLDELHYIVIDNSRESSVEKEIDIERTPTPEPRPLGTVLINSQPIVPKLFAPPDGMPQTFTDVYGYKYRTVNNRIVTGVEPALLVRCTGNCSIFATLMYGMISEPYVPHPHFPGEKMEDTIIQTITEIVGAFVKTQEIFAPPPVLEKIGKARAIKRDLECKEVEEPLAKRLAPMPLLKPCFSRRSHD